MSHSSGLVDTTYPFIAMLCGFSFSLFLNCASMMKNILSSQHQRGSANGIIMAGVSLFNGIGPAVGGSWFSWAERRQDAFFLPGIQMVFFILNVIELIGLLMTLKPFLIQPHEMREDR